MSNLLVSNSPNCEYWSRARFPYNYIERSLLRKTLRTAGVPLAAMARHTACVRIRSLVPARVHWTNSIGCANTERVVSRDVITLLAVCGSAMSWHLSTNRPTLYSVIIVPLVRNQTRNGAEALVHWYSGTCHGRNATLSFYRATLSLVCQ